MRATYALALPALVLAACHTDKSPTLSTCEPTVAEAVWLDDSISAWQTTTRSILGVEDRPVPPTMVFFNEACVFRGAGGPPWTGAPFDGQVPLPDGSELPPQVTSFASSYDDDRQVFFVMALPSIWEAGGIKSSELGLERLMSGVLIHEMTHTFQFEDFIPIIVEADRRYSLGDSLTDDIVQDTFESDPEYVAAYQAERDLLFRSAAAETDGEARRLAAEALSLIRARRARYMTGEHQKLLELEDVFLTMEGVAQWASHAWLSSAEGAGLPPEAVLAGVRRGGSKWSQDEGLAIYLVADRLVPDWKAHAFGSPAETALDVLARAAAGG